MDSTSRINQWRERRQAATGVVAISGRKARTVNSALSGASGGADPGGVPAGGDYPSTASGATAIDAARGFLLNQDQLNVGKLRQ